MISWLGSGASPLTAPHLRRGETGKTCSSWPLARQAFASIRAPAEAWCGVSFTEWPARRSIKSREHCPDTSNCVPYKGLCELRSLLELSLAASFQVGEHGSNMSLDPCGLRLGNQGFGDSPTVGWLAISHPIRPRHSGHLFPSVVKHIFTPSAEFLMAYLSIYSLRVRYAET
jgi:hypothetical protein